MVVFRYSGCDLVSLEEALEEGFIGLPSRKFAYLFYQAGDWWASIIIRLPRTLVTHLNNDSRFSSIEAARLSLSRSFWSKARKNIAINPDKTSSCERPSWTWDFNMIRMGRSDLNGTDDVLVEWYPTSPWIPSIPPVDRERAQDPREDQQNPTVGSQRSPLASCFAG